MWIMECVNSFYNYLFVIIIVIMLFVLVLLIWVCLCYNCWVNFEVWKFSYNMMIEIIWMVVLVIILVVIVGLLFLNLFYQENEFDLELIVQSGDMDDFNVYVEVVKEGWIMVKVEGMGNWVWIYYYVDEFDVDGYLV